MHMVQQWLEYFSHSLMSRSLWASLLQQRIKDIISAKVVSICGHNFLGKIRPRLTTKTRLLGRMHSVGCLFSLELLLSSSSLVFAVWLRWMLWKSISCITRELWAPNQIAVKKVCCLPIGCSQQQHSFHVLFATLWMSQQCVPWLRQGHQVL